MSRIEAQIRRIRDLINDECIKRVPPGSRELPAIGGSGFYTWQFYLRRVLLDPGCLAAVCEDFWDRFLEAFRRQPFQIAGVESAALPIIAALVLDAQRRGIELNAFSIRKQRKEYGLRNLIEGRPSDLPVLIVDDLTSPQHNSLWHAIHAINLNNLGLAGLAYVLVLKRKKGESNVIPTSFGPLFVQSLFTLSDFDLSAEDYDEAKRLRMGASCS